jgi:hypothetical protein
MSQSLVLKQNSLRKSLFAEALMIYCDKACFRAVNFASTSPDYGGKQGEQKQAKSDQISKYCKIYTRYFFIVFTFDFCYDNYAWMFGKHP